MRKEQREERTLRKDIFHRACYITWTVSVVLFFMLFDYIKVNISGGQAQEHYELLTDYEVMTQTDETVPVGIRKKYTFTLKGIEDSYCELVFYCIHQNAAVYLENDCIYTMKMQDGGISGKSPGYVWNALSFSEEDNGKRVSIEITPVYSSSVEIVPIMYFGNRYDIAREIIMDSLWNLLFSVVVIALGFMYIFFVLFNNRKTSVESNLSMLGFFAIQLGLWKLSESEAINFLFAGHPALSQITFVTLMFMGISMVLYIKELYSTRENRIWYIPCVLGFVNIIVTLLLQFAGIADMRQMLPFTHAVIGVSILITIVMTVYEVRSVGWNKRLKLNIGCLAGCFVGAGIDMLFYYASKGDAPSVFSMLGFLNYILVLGISSMQEVKELMQFGIKAQKYEQLAYHDQLTGLYNRTAYEEFTGSQEFDPEGCIVLIMDLNNLKSCNDVLGHDKGDIYIREAARLIKECFGTVGNCYRMGGDEFYVLMKNETADSCRERMAQLQERIAMCGAVGEHFKMGIACGFKIYDRCMDRNISETARRADKAMYQDKFAMKSEADI